MGEALRLLGLATDQVDSLTKTLAEVSRAKEDFRDRLETTTKQLDDWQADAEGHRKANESLQRRVEELEKSCKDLSEEVNDMIRVRSLLNDAAIEGPTDIAMGTEISSRVRVALKTKEEAEKREFDLMKFLADNTTEEPKDATEAIPLAIGFIQSALKGRVDEHMRQIRDGE